MSKDKDDDQIKMEKNIKKSVEADIKESNKLAGSKLNKLENEANTLIYSNGMNTTLQTLISKDAIKRLATASSAHFNYVLGGENSTILNRLSPNSLLDTSIKEVSKINDKNTNTHLNKSVKSLYDKLNETDSNVINDLLFSENYRLEDYMMFREIVNFIPICAEALSVYTDMTISPDDMSSKRLIVSYDDPYFDEKTKLKVTKQCDTLIAKYNVMQFVEEGIRDSLRDGDKFFAILNLREELSKEIVANQDTIINESNEFLLKEAEEYKIDYSEAANLFKSSVIDTKLLVESFEEELESYKMIQNKEQVNKKEIRYPNYKKTSEELDVEIIANSVIDYLNEFTTIIPKDRINISTKTHIESSDIIKQLKSLSSPNINKLINDKAVKGKFEGHQLKTKLEKEEVLDKLKSVNGSFIKKFDSENVIKLYNDNIVFGYLCFEIPYGGLTDFGRKRSVASNQRILSSINTAVTNYHSPSYGMANEIVDTGSLKHKLIHDLIVHTLAKKFDLGFLSSNPQFANDAMRILSMNKNKGKRIAISFIPSDQMVHFSPSSTFGYGESIFAKAKLFAKLYIGAMTAAFLRNAIRKPERYVVWINMGLDNDAENRTQEVIRAIKQKEVKFDHLKNITTTIRNIGEFRDFYIPVVNGEKPVEFENITTGNVAEVDTPYLEFLRKQVIVVSGIPGSYIGYSEDVSFARTLSTDNAKVLRRTIRYQENFTISASKFLRLLYINEYLPINDIISNTPNSKKDKRIVAKDSQIDISKINCSFPRPVGLFLNNIGDFISQSQSIINMLADDLKLVGEDETSQRIFKQLLSRHYLPQLPWDIIDSIVEKAIILSNKEKIKNKQDGNTGEEGGNSEYSDDSSSSDNQDFGNDNEEDTTENKNTGTKDDKSDDLDSDELIDDNPPKM